MQIVIDIPVQKYKWIVENPQTYTDDLCKAIANGTPLPKGHGRLGDLDTLETEMVSGIKAGNYVEGYEEYGNINNMDDCVDCIKHAPTIIEADKESEGK